MEAIPATAPLNAKKPGVPYAPDSINDRDLNLKLGTGYLKLLLEDFEVGAPRPKRAPAATLAQGKGAGEGCGEELVLREAEDYMKVLLKAALLRDPRG